ncbi:hypothetical protein [Flammeovirga sp. EKP202]|uniref:hypothetical protein n=1 Tax=Flammeovirga sp. EKP202 TaxID=2770592 RepID=UPI00165EE869|nr:hypothetical protein [Flammeovirga sp. EKP202]MBD0401485.1 hypothetical protein [Flammeovirga sp. EKP202]
MNKHNPEDNGNFNRGHAGTSEDPFVINFNYEMLKGISGHKNISTIFEETFHAGQTDFYGLTNWPSGIDIEVKAKVVKAIEGFSNDFRYEGFDKFKTALKEGTVSNDQMIKFELKVYEYAKKKVSKIYVKYKMDKGMSKEDAERSYGIKAFKGNFKYAEKLYGTKFQSEGAEVTSPKNR